MNGGTSHPSTSPSRPHRWLEGDASGLEGVFPTVVILLCFLHAWLKIRDRAEHLKGHFAEVSRRVWEAYHATAAAPATAPLSGSGRPDSSGVVLEKVLDLCSKRPRWSLAYLHSGGRRTSNMLDRLMRGMNRSFDRGQHLHGSREACRLHCRAWALLWNFTPWHPATTRRTKAGVAPPNASTSTGIMTVGCKIC